MEGLAKAAEIVLTTILVLSIWRYLFIRRELASMRSIAIVVLGDIGRSPRMMYHAESFASNNFETFLIGYRGSKPVPSLLSIPHVRFMYLAETPAALKRLPFLLLAPIKIVTQVATILYALLVSIPHPPEFVMVQNPPSIPTLALVWLVCRIRGSKLIIDWHNLGYSILALRLGKGHILVRLAEKFEATFGRTAYIHLFVTKAMRDHLVKKWDLQGLKVVLHDRPPAHFHRASAFEIHDLFLRLRTSFSSTGLSAFLPHFSVPRSTPFTRLEVPVAFQVPDQISTFASHAKIPVLRPDRPALLVSSTSWTPDEDFGLLLKALQLYERRAQAIAEGNQRVPPSESRQTLPKIVMVVTGKGPLRDKYMADVMRLEAEESWNWVRCRSLWLEATDYPLFLGSADLGICLHSSSSALDLPMKVVDMFGCGLPVCALDFDCLPELVRENENGLIFGSAEGLAKQLEILLTNFPESTKLNDFRKYLTQRSKMPHTTDCDESSGGMWEWCTWAENWDKVLRPLILHGVHSR